MMAPVLEEEPDDDFLRGVAHGISAKKLAGILHGVPPLRAARRRRPTQRTTRTKEKKVTKAAAVAPPPPVPPALEERLARIENEVFTQQRRRDESSVQSICKNHQLNAERK